jgi:uncharacterized protein with NAD-binding domain and iron-sulfur cluster
MAKERVIILGGGIAGLTTAFELTSDPHWKDKVESVTLYQMGWRLGGKCASGRGPMDRIEEHGIHLFGGGYYNALPMMERCYDALRAGPQGWPHSFDMAFRRQYLSVGWETTSAGSLVRSTTDFPRNSLRPKDVKRLREVKDWVRAMVGTWRELFTRSATPTLFGSVTILDSTPFSLPDIAIPFSKAADYFALIEEQLDAAIDGTPQGLADLVESLDGAQAWLADYHDFFNGGLEFMGFSSSIRNIGTIGDLVVALIRGALEADVFHNGFDAIDNEDFRAWLKRHGARQTTLDSSLVMSTPNVLYQYPNGNNAVRQNATMGAGCFLHWTLRTLGYLGAPFWFFAAGTGETVIAPLYEELKRRGVKFNFFHKVSSLKLSTDKRRVASIAVDVQATTLGGQEYAPLRPVGGLGCWPAMPDFSQLVQGATLEAQGVDLESHWADWPAVSQLSLCDGQDYTSVVFAISLGAVPALCNELLSSSAAWRKMVSALPTVQTQSFQIWMSQTSSALGVGLDPSDRTDADDTALGCGYETPFDGFVDFTPLIGFENWQPPHTAPSSLWYFSDVLLHQSTPAPPAGAGTAFPQSRLNAVKSNSRTFLTTGISRLLPHFNLANLVPTGTANAFDQQFFKANIDPSELYVQSPPRSTAFRLKPWETGCSNLFIAGDWTYNGLNVGCVEAAVMSGRLASHAITGFPAISDIVGFFGAAAPLRPPPP